MVPVPKMRAAASVSKLIHQTSATESPANAAAQPVMGARLAKAAFTGAATNPGRTPHKRSTGAPLDSAQPEPSSRHTSAPSGREAFVDQASAVAFMHTAELLARLLKFCRSW